MSSGSGRTNDPSENDRLNSAFAEYLRRSRDDESFYVQAFVEEFPDVRNELEELIRDDQLLVGDSGSEETVLFESSAGKQESQPVPNRLGDFKVLEKVGQGGMGIVFRAEQMSIGDRIVALKIMPSPAFEMDGSRLTRFQNEIAAAGRLDHPNIVPIYASSTKADVPFYAMKFIDGMSFSQFVRSAVKDSSEAEPKSDETTASNGSTSGSRTIVTPDQLLRMAISLRARSSARYFKLIAELFADLADGLHHAHETGVVHRDIKPANIMLDSLGHPWITDFGLAQITTSEDSTRAGTLVGTLRYMSPEQAYAQRVMIDHRTDIYSLGVTLYEVLTLKPAFDRATEPELLTMIAFEEPRKPRAIRREIPEELQTITLKAIEKSPDERYNSAAEFAADLRRYANNQPIHARPPGPVARLHKWISRNKTLATAIATITLTVLVSAAMLGHMASKWQQGRADREKAWRTEIEAKNTQLTESLTRSRSLRIAGTANLVLPENPGLAVRLAREADRMLSTRESREAVLAALRESHELVRVVGQARVGSVSFSADEKLLVHTTGPIEFRLGPYPAIVSNADSGEEVCRLEAASGTSITSAVFSPVGRRVLTCSSPRRNVSGRVLQEFVNGNQLGHTPEVFNGTTGELLYPLAGCFLVEANQAAFSPTGQKLIAPTTGTAAQIFDAIDGSPLTTLTGHTQRVVFAAFDPTGNHALTVSEDDTIRIWDARTGEQKVVIDYGPFKLTPQLRSAVVRAYYSPDGTELVTETGDRRLRFFDPATGKESRSGLTGHRPIFGELLAHQESLATVVREPETHQQLQKTTGELLAVSQDGSRLVLTRDNTLFVYETRSGKRLGELRGHAGAVQTAIFDSTGDRVVSGSDDESVRVWSVASGAERLRLASLPKNNPNSAAVPVGTDAVLLHSVPTSYTSVWNLSERRLLHTSEGHCFEPAFDGTTRLVWTDDSVRVDEGVDQVVRTMSGRFKATADIHAASNAAIVIEENGAVWFWKYRDGTRQLVTGLAEPVLDTHFRADGKAFAVAVGTACQIRDSETLKTIQALAPHDSRVASVRFSPSGKRIATCTDQGTVTIWDAAGQLLHEFPHRERKPHKVRFASEDRIVCFTTGSLRNAPGRLYDLKSGELRFTFDEGRILGLRTTSDANQLLVWGEQGAWLWNAETDERQQLSNSPTKAAAVSIDQDVFVRSNIVSQRNPIVGNPQFAAPLVAIDSIADDSTTPLPGQRGDSRFIWQEGGNLFVTEWKFGARLYDTTTGAEQMRSPGHAALTPFGQVTADGKRVVLASWDGVASVVDRTDGTALHTMSHAAPIVAADIHEDLLVVGLKTGDVVFWSLETGERTQQQAKHDGYVTHVCFRSDGKQLLTTGNDGVIKTLDLDTGQWSSINVGTALEALQFVPGGTRFLAIRSRLAPNEADDAPDIQLDDSLHLFDAIDAKPNKLIRTEPGANGVGSGTRFGVRLSPDGRFLLEVRSGELVVWDVATGQTHWIINDIRPDQRSVAWTSADHFVTKSRTDLTVWSVSKKSIELQTTSDDFVRPYIGPRTNPRILTGNPDWLIVGDGASAYRTPLNPADVAARIPASVLHPSERETYSIPPKRQQGR